jgi:hypothetical protein
VQFTQGAGKKAGVSVLLDDGFEQEAGATWRMREGMRRSLRNQNSISPVKVRQSTL